MRARRLAAAALGIGLLAAITLLVGNDPGRDSVASTSHSTRPAASGSAGVVNQAGTYPLRVSGDGRTLVDASGRPYPLLGRASWFALSLGRADYERYLDDTAAKGFTAIEVYLGHDPRGNRPPRDGLGNLPFLQTLSGQSWSGELSYEDAQSDTPDFTTPNPSYWSYVDGLLTYAQHKGIAVLFFPAYLGYKGGEQGWMTEVAANGGERMRSYGAFVAHRYQNRGNIIWMLGGDYSDFSSEQAAAEQGFIDGLRSVPGASRFYSAEWRGDLTSSEQQPFGRETNLDGAYTWGDVVENGRRAYSNGPVQPAFLLEGPYDEEGPDGTNVNPASTHPVRRYVWWGWLSTIGGYVAGNGYVWPFRPGWDKHLDTQGAQDLTRLNTFVRSVAWHQLIPSGLNGMRTLVTTNAGTGQSAVTAAATPDGTLLVAYLPPARQGSPAIDMSAMRGPVTARWFDPTTGRFAEVAGPSFANRGSLTFAPPGRNGAGDTDWVLVLQSS